MRANSKHRLRQPRDPSSSGTLCSGDLRSEACYPSQEPICIGPQSKILLQSDFESSPCVAHRGIPIRVGLYTRKGLSVYDVSLNLPRLRTCGPRRMVADRAKSHVRWMSKNIGRSGPDGNSRRACRPNICLEIRLSVLWTEVCDQARPRRPEDPLQPLRQGGARPRGRYELRC